MNQLIRALLLAAFVAPSIAFAEDEEFAPFSKAVTVDGAVLTPEVALLQDDRLAIRFRLTNTTKDGRILYHGWPDEIDPETEMIERKHVTDDKGNLYWFYAPVPDDFIYRSKTLDPGESIRVTFYCEKPVAAATELKITIPGSGLGLKGRRLEEPFRFVLTADDWRPKPAKSAKRKRR